MSIIDDVKELLRDGDVRDGTCDLLLDAIEALSGSSTAIAKSYSRQDALHSRSEIKYSG